MNIIYLVRHGETDANRNYIVQGRIDNPLNQHGLEQAKITGEYLKAHNEHFDLIVASPLKRAYESAKMICKTLSDQKTILTQSSFIERNFGDYDGKKINEDYIEMIKLGSIPNMEKNDVLESRVMNALQDLCDKHPDKKILVVTHSHVIKAAFASLVPGFQYSAFLGNCSINIIHFDGKKFTAGSYNIDTQN
jgi:uncharacterized phosphatase